MCDIEAEHLVYEHTAIACHDDLGIIGDDAEQTERGAVDDGDRFLLCLFHRTAGELIDDKTSAAYTAGREKFGGSVCGTDGGAGRFCNDICRIGNACGEHEGLTDTAGGIDKDKIISGTADKTLDNGFECEGIHAVFKAIRRGNKEKVFVSSVAQDGSFHGNSAEGDVADVIDNIIGHPRDEIKATVSEIAVDQENAFAASCNCHCEIGTHRRFSDAAFAGGEKNDLCALGKTCIHRETLPFMRDRIC